MNTLKIAISQMDTIIGNKKKNIEKALNILDKVAHRVDIICFPELFTTGYNLDIISKNIHELSETIHGETTEIFSKKAEEYNLSIVGNIIEKDKNTEDTLYNTTFFINEHGNYVGKYRKIHLYPGEEKYFEAGKDINICEINGIKVSSAICFDHAFGEIFRIMALKGAEIIFIPSVVPKGFEYLLDLRTRARAQDNQVYTVAVNRVGKEGKNVYCGKSKIVNPKGEVICEGSDDEEIIIGEIDTSLILKERQQEPVLENIRFDIYFREYK